MNSAVRRTEFAKYLGMVAVLLSGLGIFIATSLTVIHLRGAVMPCGGSSGCAVVADSRFSSFFGIPVAAIGDSGYAILLVLSILSGSSIGARRLGVVVAGLGFVASLGLILLSLLVIHASCLWCLASAATMTLLFIVALARNRISEPVRASGLTVFALCCVGVAVAGTVIVSRKAQPRLVDAAVLHALSQAELAPPDAAAEGAPDSPVTLVEFADFACPACRDIHGRLKKLLSHVVGIRLVFREYPQPQLGGHEASRYGAISAEIAAAAGKFWPFADEAFTTPNEPGSKDYDRILKNLAVLRTGEDQADARVTRDLALGKRLGISLTPTFIVLAPGAEPVACTNVNLAQILQKPPFATDIRTRPASR